VIKTNGGNKTVRKIYLDYFHSIMKSGILCVIIPLRGGVYVLGGEAGGKETTGET